jgi:hypothetical protein
MDLIDRCHQVLDPLAGEAATALPQPLGLKGRPEGTAIRTSAARLAAMVG